jgi:3-methylcrotonyl-CoA carboxylase alpha subunit
MSWIEVEVAGRSHRVAAARGTEGLWISIAGRSSFHPDPKRHAKGAGPGVEQDEVRAPMTGKVVAVEVAPGDSVAEGALLAILEAMKMEYRLTAPRAGKVAGVHCQAGQLVDLGKPLVTLLAVPPSA